MVFSAVLILFAGIGLTYVSSAQDKAFEGAVEDTIVVIGSKAAEQELLGAGYYIDGEEWRKRGYDDINRALRVEPGIYLREEDGYGLFPNISLRGVDSQRTSKLTVMEDGIPTAPAPYSAPSAYYSPSTGRMHAIEVLKGSSQIEFGPHTTGGIVNYVSTPVPDEPRAYINTSYGSNNDYRLHAWGGASRDKPAGRYGGLAEIFLRDTDGYKTIRMGDINLNTYIDDDTGFKRLEGMAKVFWEPGMSWHQRIEFKIGHTTLDANETYLGLSDADFQSDPYQRYIASFRDNIDTEQWRSYLRWTAKPIEDLTVSVTAFYNKFFRNWYKYHGSSSLKDSNLEVLRGNTVNEDSREFEYRNNRRFYNSRGVEVEAEYHIETGPVSHKWRAGVRWMSDYIRRDQNDESYNINAADGTVTITDDGRCSGACRKQESDAIAVFISDEMTCGKFRLAPGIRYEYVDQESRRYRYDRANGSIVLDDKSGGINGKDHFEDSIGAFSPGVSAGVEPIDGLNIFAGIHRGVFIPSPSAHARGGLEEETSIATEFGVNWKPAPFAYVNTVLFYTKFDNLIVVDNIGSGGGGNDQNVGNVNSLGWEFLAGFDWASHFGMDFANPWYVSMTFTNAELDGDANSEDVESLFSGGKDGNNVPYIPSYQIAFGTGIEWWNLGLFADVYFVDETYTTAGNVDSPPTDGNGKVTDYRIGKTDSYGIVDISAKVQLTEALALTGSVHNLFDKKYIVSRHPIGPRPGLPRSLLIGITANID